MTELPPRPASLPPGKRLEARGLRWSAGGMLILDEVTLEARPGSLLGVIGPNGSGKSSLARSLAGLLTPDGGRVLLDGQDTARMRRRELARHLAFVEQETSTDVDLRVGDVVRLGRLPFHSRFDDSSAEDDRISRSSLEDVGLAGFERRRWSTLSGGERQRVQVARALAQRPSVLVLDEPLNHLDVHHQFELLDLVATSTTTVVIVLHDIPLAARYCDDLLVLNGGRVAAFGPPRTVLTEPLLADVFRVHGRVHHHDGITDVRLTGSLGRGGRNEATTDDGGSSRRRDRNRGPSMATLPQPTIHLAGPET